MREAESEGIKFTKDLMTTKFNFKGLCNNEWLFLSIRFVHSYHAFQVIEIQVNHPFQETSSVFHPRRDKLPDLEPESLGLITPMVINK